MNSPSYKDKRRKLTQRRWIRELGQIFQSRGVAILQDGVFAHENDVTYAYAWTTMHMLGLAELVNVAGKGSKRVHDLLERASGEARNGGSFNMNLVSVVGRKGGSI